MESSRVKEAQQRVSNDQWDIDAWMVLLIEAQQSPFIHAKPVYEKLVVQFPPSGKIWRTYAEHMACSLKPGDDDAPVMDLYERAIIDAPTSVELWLSFATFATNRVIKAPTTASTTLETDAVSVHERAISVAGLDAKADVLWKRYFSFLSSRTSMSDTQRRDALRRLHQRAVMLCTVFSPHFPPSMSVGVVLCIVACYVSSLPKLREKKKEFSNYRPHVCVVRIPHCPSYTLMCCPVLFDTFAFLSLPYLSFAYYLLAFSMGTIFPLRRRRPSIFDWDVVLLPSFASNDPDR